MAKKKPKKPIELKNDGSHVLNKDVARLAGTNAALLVTNIAFFIEKNIANRSKKHHHLKRYWTYYTYKALHKLCDYLTTKQVRTAIDNAIEGGVLIKNSFNEKANDDTNWYALTDLGMEIYKLEYLSPENDEPELPDSVAQKGNRVAQKGSRVAQKGKPLPNISPDVIPNINNTSETGVSRASVANKSKKQLELEIVELFMYWQMVFNKPMTKLLKGRYKILKWALTHYSLDECKLAIDGNRLDKHNMNLPGGHNKSGKIYCEVKTIFRDEEQVERLIEQATKLKDNNSYDIPKHILDEMTGGSNE